MRLKLIGSVSCLWIAIVSTFAVSQESPVSLHPSGSTPLERITVLAHTDGLPSCDRVVIYALDFRDPFDDTEDAPIPKDLAFPIRPYAAQARILGSKTLAGKDVEPLCVSWRSLSFDAGAGAFCHEPVYGLRFYLSEKLLFETSVCWKCNNFFIPKVSASKTSTLGPDVDHQWYGFQKDKASARLLALLKNHLEHPKLVHPK